MGFVPGNLQKLFDILEEDENVDAVAMEVSGTFIGRRMKDNPGLMDAMVDALAAQKDKSSKPFLAIAQASHLEDVLREMRSKLLDRGVATFTSFAAAAKAMRRATAYWRFREGLD